MLQELPINYKGPPLLNVDNNSAVQVATNVAPTRKRNHINVRFHYLQDHVTEATITLKHVPSTEMLADPLTKPLSEALFTSLHTKMRLCPLAATPRVGGTDTPQKAPTQRTSGLRVVEHPIRR